MTPIEWEIACAKTVHWSRAFPIIEREVRAFLKGRQGMIGTKELVDNLYPMAAIRGSLYVRNRLFRALLASKPDGSPAIAEDCRIRGPLKRVRGGVKAKTWLWHAPKLRTVCCPNCQFEFELDS